MKKSKHYVFNVWRKLDKHWGFTSLYDIHKQIKSSAFSGEINFYRRLKEEKDFKKDHIARSVKFSLISFTPSGIFDETKNRSDESLIEYNGLMVLNINKLESTLKVNEVFKNIIEISYTSLAFISPSGYGVKIIVATNNICPTLHTFCYKKLVKNFEDILKVRLDYGTCDLSSLCFLSYDPNAYFNPNAIIYEFKDLHKQ
jgi:hypothetical protein